MPAEERAEVLAALGLRGLRHDLRGTTRHAVALASASARLRQRRRLHSGNSQRRGTRGPARLPERRSCLSRWCRDARRRGSSRKCKNRPDVSFSSLSTHVFSVWSSVCLVRARGATSARLRMLSQPARSTRRWAWSSPMCPDAGILDLAAQHGIPARYLPPGKFKTKLEPEREQELASRVAENTASNSWCWPVTCDCSRNR